MRRADGKIDRRSTEYQEAVVRMAKARRAMRSSRKPARARPSSGSRRADGKMDQRTAKGKAVADRMAAMRATAECVVLQVDRARAS